MELVNTNWADLLEPTLVDIFDVRSTQPDPMRDMLFDVKPHDKLQGRYTGIGARRIVPAYRGEVESEDFDQYYRTDITNYLFDDSVIVERTLLEDDQFGVIQDRIANWTDAFPETQEYDAAQVFINAFTDSGTYRTGESTNGADGVALLSAAHPYSPRKSGTTQSNEGTLAFSYTNAVTTRLNMRKWTDDKGERLNVKPDMVLVPVDLEQEALKAFPQSENSPNVFEPDGAQFDANIFHSRVANNGITVVIWNRLTDVNSWFMIDSKLMKRHLKWQERVTPEMEKAPGGDIEKQQWTGRMRYGIGWTHWAWIFGQNPS